MLAENWVTVRKATTCTHESRRVSRAFYIRELSGPRPLRRVVDIVSRLRIWSRGAKAILLDNRPALQVTGSGRTVLVLLQPYCTLAFTSTHDCPVPLVCARWKFSEIEGKISLHGTLLRRIYISLAIRTVTQWVTVHKAATVCT